MSDSRVHVIPICINFGHMIVHREDVFDSLDGSQVGLTFFRGSLGYKLHLTKMYWFLLGHSINQMTCDNLLIQIIVQVVVSNLGHRLKEMLISL